VKAVLMMYKVFLNYPEALRPAFPKLKEKLEDAHQDHQIGKKKKSLRLRLFLKIKSKFVLQASLFTAEPRWPSDSRSHSSKSSPGF
jgi:hypothetical protein